LVGLAKVIEEKAGRRVSITTSSAPTTDTTALEPNVWMLQRSTRAGKSQRALNVSTVMVWYWGNIDVPAVLAPLRFLIHGFGGRRAHSRTPPDRVRPFQPALTVTVLLESPAVDARRPRRSG
jgi:hypothetical protein